MAKDPAFLFYSSDFVTGTFTMTDEQVGKYIRLLCLQHQKGILTEKDMLFICKTYDEDIYSKFVKTESGYLNIRLKEESDKRSKYSESRRNNKLKTYHKHMLDISSSYDEHMENENINEDEDKNKDEIKKGKPKIKFVPPHIDEVKQFFEENGYTNAERAWNYYNDAGWKDSTGKPVKNWKQKMRGVWFREENLKPASKPKRMTSDDIIAEMTEKYKHGIPTQDASSRL